MKTSDSDEEWREEASLRAENGLSEVRAVLELVGHDAGADGCDEATDRKSESVDESILCPEGWKAAAHVDSQEGAKHHASKVTE